MKRCPQCSFLYLDSDQLCDLDKTPLVADDFGTDLNAIGHRQQKADHPPVKGAVHRRQSFKILLAAFVAILIIGLMLLITYQKMRTFIQARQAQPNSRAQASHAPQVTQVAPPVANEVAAEAKLEEQGSNTPAAQDGNTSPSVQSSTATIAKTTSNARPDATRVRASSNPVSTSEIEGYGRGSVTIRLANGTTLEADEVWRTKAGIWYRRKGIVTFIKPNRVRSMITTPK